MFIPDVMESESDSDVLNLNLFTKYLNYIESQQDIKSCYANLHLLYEHLQINFSELKYRIPYNYSKKLKECLSSKKIEYIIIPISLVYTDYAHYNIVIINKKKSTFEYFEPMGLVKIHRMPYFEVENHIYGIIKFLFLENDKPNILDSYKFINAHINCPIGLQTKQMNTIDKSFTEQYGPLYKNNKMYSNKYGLCVAWCLLIIHIRLLNQELNIDQIVDVLVNIYTSTELNQYIRKYTYMIENSKDLKQVNSYISFDEHNLKLTWKEIKYNNAYIKQFKSENNKEMLKYFTQFKIMK